ncbi:hypothetical protein PFISCL1PPCAC_19749 [Pristionchus fissidentatus]|uniref:Alpha-amylase/branching enzyme C-terminal all beta domain-containing protein n=1 Tax=Pristionchus fissidentatus TaxID=1538716 RepID=A0AAV5WEU0_9BILA|nr:hypothetical protein PFISCL1PPCAC_19749 [Pristionchus fissidentatus]
MNLLEEKQGFLHEGPAYVSWKHEGDEVIAFERGPLVFVFNFHHEKSFADYKVGVNYENGFAVVLCYDDAKFGGHSRVDPSSRYSIFRSDWADRIHHICVYVPLSEMFRCRQLGGVTWLTNCALDKYGRYIQDEPLDADYYSYEERDDEGREEHERFNNIDKENPSPQPETEDANFR